LDAAAATFLRKGYAATTLNDIAKASRLRVGSLYYHFDSKERLLDVVLRTGVERLFTAVRQAVEAIPPESPHLARLEAAIGAHLAMLIEGGNYTSCTMRIFGQLPPTVRRRQMPLREAYGEYWRGLIAEAAAKGELRADIDLSLARMFLFGALNWTPEWFKRSRGGAEVAARQLSRLFLAGLARG
jgi:AcrR family transcriptional regulator